MSTACGKSSHQGSDATTNGQGEATKLVAGLSVTADIAESEHPAVVVVTERVSEEVAEVVLQSRYEVLVDVAVAEFLRRLRVARAEAPGAAQVVAVAVGGNR